MQIDMKTGDEPVAVDSLPYSQNWSMSGDPELQQDRYNNDEICTRPLRILEVLEMCFFDRNEASQKTTRVMGGFFDHLWTLSMCKLY